ncbi:MAG: excinuclease ABC subunit UvrC [Lachnospiraceae bacterium]|nr:excinuclease ABC subunit UvrC [Lachnospiraceae bacterium]
MENDFVIEEELKKLPAQPGVYIMHDETDEIIYVGKAVSLKNRVRQYFQKSQRSARGPKIESMIGRIHHFEYIVTDSELEALVLENNLIKEHRPKYNTMLMDDKTYPFIKVTVGETWPQVQLARQIRKDSSRYFGPFTNVTAVRDTIDLVRKLYKIRPCRKKIVPGKTESCLYYHIGQCEAPCLGHQSEEAYREQVKKAVSFLGGHVDEEIASLTDKMMAASEDMRFEEAAGYRDLIDSIRQVTERQKITGTGGDDRDVMAIAVNSASDAAQTDLLQADCVVQVFFVRNGKLIGREHFYMEVNETEDPAILLSEFITQYYSGTPYIPGELMLPFDLPDRELLSDYLTRKKGARVAIRIPQKGIKEKLVTMAAENAAMVLNRDRERLRREELRTAGAVRQIAELLGIPSAERMEAFDISNISGFESVGSMVVYEKGRPKRTDYRKFRIKTVIGPNDYASMEEVLTRRFKRASEGSQGFERLPDLIMMDGGRGQVNIAESVLAKMGLSIPVAGMVKDDNHRTRGLYFHNKEIMLDRHAEVFQLITRLQDEAHRFAIEYHRLLRSKGQVHSVLDDIPGIGTTRRRALMKHFKTIEEIRLADVDTLKAVPGMNEAAARSVFDFFRNNTQPKAESED